MLNLMFLAAPVPSPKRAPAPAPVKSGRHLLGKLQAIGPMEANPKAIHALTNWMQYGTKIYPTFPVLSYILLYHAFQVGI